jgi:hypothetical protein
MAPAAALEATEGAAAPAPAAPVLELVAAWLPVCALLAPAFCALVLADEVGFVVDVGAPALVALSPVPVFCPSIVALQAGSPASIRSRQNRRAGAGQQRRMACLTWIIRWLDATLARPHAADDSPTHCAAQMRKETGCASETSLKMQENRSGAART